MFINKNCQLCEKDPREKAVLYFEKSVLIFLLCSTCSNIGKFVEAKDVTPKFDLTDTYLRDIKRNEGKSDRYDKAFLFQSKSNLKIYLFVPTLDSGYSRAKVLDCESGEVVQIGWDASISILKLETAQLLRIIQINNIIKLS